MKTLSAADRKNNIKKVSTCIDAAVEALTAAVAEDLESEKGFGDYECTVLEKSNEICRRVLSNRLKDIAHECENDFFFDKRS
jgi:predicted hotdog family 3-hydroxylacyl-ACP dehydratase